MKIAKDVLTSSDLDNIQNICILCWGRIGDVFFRVPIIESVKKKYPNSKIFAVVDSCGYEILENHPDVSEVIIVNKTKKPRLQYIKEVFLKCRILRKSKIDLCINLYSGGSSAAFSWLINAPIRLGFDHTKKLRQFNTISVSFPGFCKHWTYCLATVLQPLGIEANSVRLGSSFNVTKKSLDDADKFIDSNNRYVIFNLATGVSNKNWPIQSYVNLAQKIYAKFGFKPLVLTNPDSPELAKEFSNLCDNSILIPRLSFDELAGLLLKVGLLVTGDTSVMHLAFGVKVPNLVLFTKTRPEIVKPDDCIHEACFIEDRNCINRCGTADGTFDIPVDYAFECFKKLKLRVDNE